MVHTCEVQHSKTAQKNETAQVSNWTSLPLPNHRSEFKRFQFHSLGPSLHSPSSDGSLWEVFILRSEMQEKQSEITNKNPKKANLLDYHSIKHLRGHLTPNSLPLTSFWFLCWLFPVSLLFLFVFTSMLDCCKSWIQGRCEDQQC